MKRLKQLNGVVRQYNGLAARTAKDPSEENKTLLKECLDELKQKVDEVMVDYS